MKDEVPPIFPFLLAPEEARASRALDGETQHAPQADSLCCLDHARERIGALEAQNTVLKRALRNAVDLIRGISRQTDQMAADLGHGLKEATNDNATE